MQLLDVYDGAAIVSIHYDELRHLVDALGGIDPPEGMTQEHMTSLAAAFEALMFAGKLQMMSFEAEQTTLRRYRANVGLRDWQPPATT